MLKWILAALAFFGITHSATAPSNTSADKKQSPTTVPSQPAPAPQSCDGDGSPYPPPPGCH